ncbi:MAG: leucyl aminopeptidase [bacterium]|nr:leucyl aminopeptidase [bacterium]
MRYTYTEHAPFDAKVEAIVVPVSEQEARVIPRTLAALDRTLNGQLTAALAAGDFTGKEHSLLALYPAGVIPAARVLLVGTGKKKDVTPLEWQHVVGAAARALQGMKAKRWALVLPEAYRKTRKPSELGALTAKGIIAATYHFAEYKSDPAARLPVPDFITVGPLSAAQAKAFAVGVAEGTAIGEAMNWMRRFGDMPSSDATPTYLADQARALAKSDKRFRLTVLDRAALEREKFGALLGVARGAATPPVCIVLEWRGNPKQPKEWRALVGKGVTFDSGGISIKPGDKMDEMKFDMSGGASVLGAMRAIGALELKTNIVGIVPATDNLPSGTAYKPGDILTTCRGKTIEVLNTDAEGRIILADGIGYALRYEPKAIVDLATLTGACIVALGTHYAGLFANDESLFRALRTASETSGERVWHLPLGDAYTREVQSDIADIQNLGKRGREGGAITAAAFLQECTEGTPWAHLDIAGTAWATDQQPWRGKGATGYGVHLLVELAKQWAR